MAKLHPTADRRKWSINLVAKLAHEPYPDHHVYWNRRRPDRICRLSSNGSFSTFVIIRNIVARKCSSVGGSYSSDTCPGCSHRRAYTIKSRCIIVPIFCDNIAPYFLDFYFSPINLLTS